jgi:hypothetical protein
MTPTSWRPGCPVGLEDLRYLRLSYWGMDSASHIGELVVHRDAVDEIGAVFAELYANRFPITQMRLVDDFGGNDDASVDADNTSAVNCRAVTGTTDRWSQHAYGQAIDINPLENPYVDSSGGIRNPVSETYRDRSGYRLGMFVEGHVGVAAFDRFGWDWGGRWSSPIDYQHFSRTGG